MKKQFICLFLSIILVFSVMPVRAAAADRIHTVRLTGSSSDFMSGYYVTYEINGNEYRSDQVGSTINRLAWNGMSESERRSVMRVFAFAPDRRIEQFGSEGSREMTDYINEKQGWTAVWEAYAKRIEDQQCGPLKEYYSAENYDAKLAELQNNAAGDYDSWYSRLMYYQEYDEAMDVRRKYEAIGQLMSTGRSAYNCIVTAYTKAREASVRAVSKDLISIIVDKALTPNITVAPTAATTGIYTGVADLFFAVTGYSDELTQKVVGKTQGGMDAVEVINAMKELAQLNYQLAAHCYRQAEALSNSIPAEAEAALAICQAKRNEEQLQAAREADAERLETEQQQRDEAIMPEKKTTLYDFIVGTPPVWAPDPNWSQSEFNSAYQQYYDRVQSYIAARQGRLDDEYDSLATDYLAWYNNYRSAITSLSESHSSPIPDPYPYRPTDDTAVLGQYIYFTDAELRAYRQACRQYRLDILNFSTDRAEYSEDARSIWASAVSGLEEINSRRSALVSALSWSYSSSNGGAVQVSFTVSQPNLYDTEEDDGVKDHTASLLDSIAAAADYWSEERAYSWEYTSQLTENLENEMVRVRGEMLDNVRESIAKHNSIKDNFDLAVQFGEQMKDRQDALLESVPDYVAELQGNLVGSSTNGQGGTTYYAPYAPGISDVYSASPKLVQMLSDASDPLAKAQQLGRQLGQIWDEYERLQRCISNAKSAVGYYVSEMDSVAGVGDIYRYRDGYNMPAITDYSDDRASFNAYLNRAKTYDQIHDLTALKLLAADLRGWGSAQTQISLKLAELKGTKSTVIRRLKDGETDLLNDLRRDITRIYTEGYVNKSFYGYARHQATAEDKILNSSYDQYGQYIELLDWLEAQYEDYVLPGGVTKLDAVLFVDDSGAAAPAGDANTDLVLPGAGSSGQLLAAVTPSNATDNGIVWENLSPDIVKVSENGVVTALAEGEAQIAARAKDAPAEPVYSSGSNLEGFSYDEDYSVIFTIKVGDAGLPAENEEPGTVWRNFGTEEAPRYTQAVKSGGVTTVTAVFRTDIELGTFCMALYDAEGRMLSCSLVSGESGTDVISASSKEDPARVTIYSVGFALDPNSVPPVDEML